MSAATPLHFAGTDNDLKATLASGEAIDVRDFYVREGLSQLYEVSLVVVSSSSNLDFEASIAKPASFSIVRAGSGGSRTYAGVCASIEQVEVAEELGGLSSYEIVIAPHMWLLTQRRNHRMFQRLSEPDIALVILREWGLEPEVRLDLGAYKAREYRLQYGESDFAFVSRMLEDAGISYLFEIAAGKSELVLTDKPHAAAPRPLPIPYVNSPNPKLHEEFLTKVSVERRTRPGRYVQRDWDFRASRPITSDAQAGLVSEAKLERFHYVPNALHFFEGPGESYPVGDDRGKFRRDESEGRTQADKRMLAKQGQAKTIRFATSLLEIEPGTVFNVDGHPSTDVIGGPLLVTSTERSGSATGEWTQTAEARSSEMPYVPAVATPKPQVMGIEPATVVGPKGEEIHVDEFGRVRVHFHWNRESAFDETSSVWIPVSHPWSGAGYGQIHHPRVGQEVLVDFLCGDPDQPIVLGRIYTVQNPVPYPLPKNKTKSGWKSQSSPGGEGYNELMFEDKKAEELVRFQAEKNYTSLTKRDSGAVVVRDSMSYVGIDQTHTVIQDQTTRVRCHRRLRIENQQLHWVDKDIYQESLESTTIHRSKLLLQQHSNEIDLFSVAEIKPAPTSLVEQPIKSFIAILPDKIIIESPHVDINPGVKKLPPPPKPDPLSRAEQRDWYFFGGPENDGVGVTSPAPPTPAKHDDTPAPAPAKPAPAPKPVAAPSTPAGTPKELPNKLTESSEAEVYAALKGAWVRRFGTEPNQDSILVLMAQWKMETGGKYMHNYNIGNVKAPPGAKDTTSWQYFRCWEKIKGKVEWFDPPHPQTRFRAFETLDQGADDYLKFLQTKYGPGWAAVEKGDQGAFVHEIKKLGYFTADEADYLKGVSSIFASLKQRIDKDGRPIPPPPPKAKVATPRKKTPPCSGGCTSPHGAPPKK